MNYQNTVQEYLLLFDHIHLPEHLKKIVQPYKALAEDLSKENESDQVIQGLKRLLEAKDCAVRANVLTNSANWLPELAGAIALPE